MSDVRFCTAVRHSVLTAGVKGTAGDFAAMSPVTLTLTFPVNGACGETRFAAPGQSCAVKSKGKTLACK